MGTHPRPAWQPGRQGRFLRSFPVGRSKEKQPPAAADALPANGNETSSIRMERRLWNTGGRAGRPFGGLHALHPLHMDGVLTTLIGYRESCYRHGS